MSPFEPWLEYIKLRRRLEAGKPRFVEVPDPRVRNCMEQLKLRPSGTPTWETVARFLQPLEVDVAAACARLALETAAPFVQQTRHERTGNDSRAPQRALEWARSSLLVAANLERGQGYFLEDEQHGRSEWVPVYDWVDPPYDERLRRDAAVATVLAAADAVALAVTGHPFEHEEYFDFIPRVEPGRHVDMTVLENRHLVLSHDPTRHVDDPIENFELWDLGRLLEDWMESGWGVGTVDELGAMSEAPYIAEDEGMDDDGVRHTSTLWYFEPYAVHSEIRQLQEEGRTGPWSPFVEGGEAVGNWPAGALAFWTGDSPGHQQFFRLWWKRCLCRIPAQDLGSVTPRTTGARSHTVSGLIARQGTEYEASVQGAGPFYTISITDGDEYTTINLQEAFLNQRGLAYPTNLFKITGHETTRDEESPLDRQIEEVVLSIPDVTRLEEVPVVIAASNPFAAIVPELQESQGVKFSRPAFATVRRRSGLSLQHLVDAVYDVLAQLVRQDKLDRIDLTLTGDRVQDLKSEVGPRGQERQLGYEAQWQLNEGRYKGFWMQQLGAYPALLRWVLRGINRSVKPVPAMDPGNMTLEEALELGGYQRHEMMQPVVRALSSPDEVWRLEVLNQLAKLTGADEAEFGAPEHRVHQAVKRIWEWMAADPDERQPMFTALRPTDLAGENVYPVLEATNYGADYLELRRAAADVLALVADFFVEHPDQLRLEDARIAKWGIDRKDAVQYAEALSDVLDVDALAAFESIRIQLDEAAAQRAQERQEAAYKRSLLWPRNNLAWVKAGATEPAREVPYHPTPGEFARTDLPEVISRDENGEFLMEAAESEEVTDYSWSGVETRPSEKITESVDELLEDAADVDDDEWEVFFELEDIPLPEDDDRWEALIEAAKERLRTDQAFRDAWLRWRLPILEEREEEDSWRYEPDTESMEYQSKLYDVINELAEKAAFDAGYALIEWIEPYRGYDQKEPVKVFVQASEAVSRKDFLKLIDDIVAANYSPRGDEDSSLAATDEIDLEHPDVTWSGTVSNYVHYARRPSGDLA